MVPLTQNPLLKLPGASSRLENMTVLPPYRALIALGLGFTVITSIFVTTEQWLALTTAETIHQVGAVYTPPITAGWKARTGIAQLLTAEADLYRSKPQTMDPHRFDNLKQEIIQPWIEASERPNTAQEKGTLSGETTALWNLETDLASINDAQASRPVDGDFSQLMEGDASSLFDSSDLLETQRARDLQDVENQNDLDLNYYVFLGVLSLGVTLLITTSVLLALWFRRILNPGVVVALGVMVIGGGVLQSQLGTALANLDKMDQMFLSIRSLGILQARVAEADLYLHSWFLTRQPSDWERLCADTSQIYSEDRAPSDAPNASFSPDQITRFQRAQETGSGFLAQAWKSSSNDPAILDSYENILTMLEQIRLNETQGKHDQSVGLLSGSNGLSGLNDSFDSFDNLITAAQRHQLATFELDRLRAQSSLQFTTEVCLFTAVAQLIAFWLGLIPRLREYMR